MLCKIPSECRFSVLCNSPNKYAVVEPEGKISRNKCADIVVRHVAVSPQSVSQTDKFRIQMYEEGDSENPISRKEVLATMHPGRWREECQTAGKQELNRSKLTC